MRSLVKIILSTVFFLLAAAIYTAFLSPSEFKARRNLKNFKHLKVGMTKNQMLQIMGEPDRLECTVSSSYRSCYYYYRPPFLSSGGIDIYTDSTDKIERLYYE